MTSNGEREPLLSDSRDEKRLFSWRAFGLGVAVSLGGHRTPRTPTRQSSSVTTPGIHAHFFYVQVLHTVLVDKTKFLQLTRPSPMTLTLTH